MSRRWPSIVAVIIAWVLWLGENLWARATASAGHV